MVTKRPLIPTPVPVTTVCSICEMPWDEHGKKPTLENCVALLKAALELAKVSPYVTPGPSAGQPSPRIPTKWSYPFISYCGEDVAPSAGLMADG
jgi:hypothetical protein